MVMGQPQPDGRLGILVGVTGHRDLPVEAIEPAVASVRQVLGALKDDYGRDAPIHVMCLLAKGADQLVATAALELGLGVLGVIPRHWSMLESDDKDAHQILERIVADKRTQIIDLSRFEELERCVAAGVAMSIDENEFRYEQAGLIVAQHAHMLIALVHPRHIAGLTPRDKFKTDGTAPIGGVRRILEFWFRGRLSGGVMGNTPLVSEGLLLRPILTGPLIHIAVPRTGDALPADVPVGLSTAMLADHVLSGSQGARFDQIFGKHGKTRILTGRMNEVGASPNNDADEEECPPLFERLCRYNRLIQADHRKVASAACQSREDLVSEAVLSDLPGAFASQQTGERDAALRALRELFGRADGLANELQRKVKLIDIVLLAAVPLSVLSFELYVEIVHAWWALAFYVFIFVALISWFAAVDARGQQNWYQDCRLLGEAARVQFFWSLAGLPRSVASEHHQNELGDSTWLHAGIKWIAMQGLLLAQRSDARAFVLRYWIGAPIDRPIIDAYAYSYRRWYRQAAQTYLGLFHSFGAGRWLAFALSYLLAFVVILALLGFTIFGHSIGEAAQMALIILVPTIAAIGGVLGLWREHRAYERHFHEYRRMTFLVREGLWQLSVSQDSNDQVAIQVLQAVGREALREASHWLLAHRSQPIGPVVSG